MLNSKSFGYAIRGMLYLLIQNNPQKFVQLEAISLKINAPKHFLAKVFRKLADAQFIDSVKGPNGGFRINEKTQNLSLLEILMVTDSADLFDHCILKWKKCNAKRPCPFHHRVTPVKNEFIDLLRTTQIKDLQSDDKALLLIQIAE